MTRCADFWKKWRKEPNFCGLSPQAISEIKGYLELVDKLVKTGIPEDTIFDMCPSGSCRPVLRLADDETKTEGINYLITHLKSGERINSKELQATLNAFLKKGASCKADSTQLRTENAPLPVEKKSEKDHVVDTNKSITAEAPVQPSLAAQQTGTVPPEPPVHRPPPCLGGGGCEKGKFRSDRVRGNVCDAIGVPINQLPGNMCPYDVKLARKSGGAFVPASQLATANKDPGIPGGKPAIPDRTLTITFSPDQWAILGKLQKAGMADGYDGAVLFCVDEIGNRSE